jgi:C-methyltransferase
MQHIFTQYWHFLAIQNACKVNLFDSMIKPITLADLCIKGGYKKRVLSFLISFLLEEQYIKTVFDASNLEKRFVCTKKGLLLTANSPKSVKNSCILWGEEHLHAWQNLAYTLKNDLPAFNYLYKKDFFEYIADNKQKLANYHLAMGEYARVDYANIANLSAFDHNVIADIGGSMGILINNLAKKQPNKRFILADLAEVLDLADNLETNVEKKPINFFNNFGFKADGLILARVLHDWEDKKAAILLKNCYDALNEGGYLYILEIMQEKINANLLSLNMLLMCESHERESLQYATLLNQNGFIIDQTIKVNELQTMLICKKHCVNC